MGLGPEMRTNFSPKSHFLSPRRLFWTQAASAGMYVEGRHSQYRTVIRLNRKYLMVSYTWITRQIICTGWLKMKCPMGKCNFSTTDTDFVTIIISQDLLNSERVSNLEQLQRIDKFKYLNVLCHFDIYADQHFDSCYFFLNFLQIKFLS